MARFLILLISILLFALPASAQSVHNPEPAQAEQAQTQQESAPQANSAPEPSVELGKSKDAGKAYNETNKHQADVKKDSLQNKDHRAQIWMNKAAWAQVLATLVGLLLIYLTFKESKKAALAAKTAADLTSEALRETKDNSGRELRAYISCKTRCPNCNGSDNYTFITKIKNYGQTPAISLNSKAIFSCDGNIVDIEYPEIQNLSISPNGEISYEVAVDKKELKGAKMVTIEFDTTFLDVFGKPRFIKETKCIEINLIPFQPKLVRIDGRAPRSANNSKVNPAFVEEIAMFTTAYEDDLQKEAEEYAKANKAS